MSSPEARKTWATIIEQPSFTHKQNIIVRDLASKFASRNNGDQKNNNNNNYIIGKAEDESFEQVLSMLQLQQQQQGKNPSQDDFHQQYLSLLGAIASKDESQVMFYILHNFTTIPLNLKKVVLKGIVTMGASTKNLLTLLYDDSYRNINHVTMYRSLLLKYIVRHYSNSDKEAEQEFKAHVFKREVERNSSSSSTNNSAKDTAAQQRVPQREEISAFGSISKYVMSALLPKSSGSTQPTTATTATPLNSVAHSFSMDALKMLSRLFKPTLSSDYSVEQVMVKFRPFLKLLGIETLNELQIQMLLQTHFGPILRRHPLLIIGLLKRELTLKREGTTEQLWESNRLASTFEYFLTTAPVYVTSIFLALFLEYMPYQRQALPQWFTKNVALLLRKVPIVTIEILKYVIQHGDTVKESYFLGNLLRFRDAPLLHGNNYNYASLRKIPTSALMQLFDLIYSKGNMNYLLTVFSSSLNVSEKESRAKEQLWKQVIAKYGIDEITVKLLNRIHEPSPSLQTLSRSLAATVAKQLYDQVKDQGLSNVQKMRLMMHFKSVHTSDSDRKELERLCFDSDPDDRAQLLYLFLQCALSQETTVNQSKTEQVIQFIIAKTVNEKSNVASSVFSLKDCTAIFNYIADLQPLFERCLQVRDEFSESVAVSKLLPFVLDALFYSGSKACNSSNSSQQLSPRGYKHVKQIWFHAIDLLKQWLDVKQHHEIGHTLNAFFTALRCKFGFHGAAFETDHSLPLLLLNTLVVTEQQWFFDPKPRFSPYFQARFFNCFPFQICKRINKGLMFNQWLQHSLFNVQLYPSCMELFKALNYDRELLGTMAHWYIASIKKFDERDAALKHILLYDPSFIAVPRIQSLLLHQHHHHLALYLDKMITTASSVPTPTTSTATVVSSALDGSNSAFITRHVLDSISKQQFYIYLNESQDYIWPIFNRPIHWYLLQSHHALKFTETQRSKLASMLLLIMTASASNSTVSPFLASRDDDTTENSNEFDFLKARLMKVCSSLIYISNPVQCQLLLQLLDHARRHATSKLLKWTASITVATLYGYYPIDGTSHMLLDNDNLDSERANWIGSALQHLLSLYHIESQLQVTILQQIAEKLKSSSNSGLVVRKELLRAVRNFAVSQGQAFVRKFLLPILVQLWTDVKEDSSIEATKTAAPQSVKTTFATTTSTPIVMHKDLLTCLINVTLSVLRHLHDEDASETSATSQQLQQIQFIWQKLEQVTQMQAFINYRDCLLALFVNAKKWIAFPSTLSSITAVNKSLAVQYVKRIQFKVLASKLQQDESKRIISKATRVLAWEAAWTFVASADDSIAQSFTEMAIETIIATLKQGSESSGNNDEGSFAGDLQNASTTGTWQQNMVRALLVQLVEVLVQAPSKIVEQELLPNWWKSMLEQLQTLHYIDDKNEAEQHKLSTNDVPVFHCLATLSEVLLQNQYRIKPIQVKAAIFASVADAMSKYSRSLLITGTLLRLFVKPWNSSKSTIVECMTNSARMLVNCSNSNSGVGETARPLDPYSMSTICNEIGKVLSALIQDASSSSIWSINSEVLLDAMNDILQHVIPKPNMATNEPVYEPIHVALLQWICQVVLSIGRQYHWQHAQCREMLQYLRKFPAFVSAFAKYERINV